GASYNRECPHITHASGVNGSEVQRSLRRSTPRPLDDLTNVVSIIPAQGPRRVSISLPRSNPFSVEVCHAHPRWYRRRFARRRLRWVLSRPGADSYKTGSGQ